MLCVMQITAISVAALTVSTTALWADGPESINHHDMMWRGLGYLRGRGKHHSAVLVAVARELAGHVWAIARMVEPKMA